MKDLFQRGTFILASGKSSDWKIECEALTDESWETLAYLISQRANAFGSVFGVPTGGNKLADCLRKYASPGVATRLLVDDVFTSGTSIGRFRQRNDDVWVVFARNRPPSGIKALFVMEN